MCLRWPAICSGKKIKYYTKLMTILKLSSVDWNAFSRYYSPPAFSWFIYILFSYEMFLLHVLSWLFPFLCQMYITHLLFQRGDFIILYGSYHHNGTYRTPVRAFVSTSHRQLRMKYAANGRNIWPIPDPMKIPREPNTTRLAGLRISQPVDQEKCVIHVTQVIF